MPECLRKNIAIVLAILAKLFESNFDLGAFDWLKFYKAAKAIIEHIRGRHDDNWVPIGAALSPVGAALDELLVALPDVDDAGRIKGSVAWLSLVMAAIKLLALLRKLLSED